MHTRMYEKRYRMCIYTHAPTLISILMSTQMPTYKHKHTWTRIYKHRRETLPLTYPPRPPTPSPPHPTPLHLLTEAPPPYVPVQ